MKSKKLLNVVEEERGEEFESLANIDSHGFLGVYHVSIGQPDLVAEAFESFIMRIIEEEEQNSRQDDNDSKIFEDTLITRKCCICRELYDNFGQPSNSPTDSPEQKHDKAHHPHCPMYKQRLRCNDHGLITG